MSIVYINPYQFAAFDPDALTYINAVETADGQALETGVRIAINDFVLGCKQDGIWNAIKASCIMAGARTLSGALVPLTGGAPTNNNFVSADYDRETGLVGDGSTKYLDSNRSNNADPQNSKHLAVYFFQAPTSGPGTGSPISYPCYLGSGYTAGDSLMQRQPTNSTTMAFKSNDSVETTIANAVANTGFIGTSRSSSANYTIRVKQSDTTASTTSTTPQSRTIEVFRQTQAGDGTYNNGRLSFYSIGESLDLAALDTRVSNLMTAIGAAIP